MSSSGMMYRPKVGHGVALSCIRTPRNNVTSSGESQFSSFSMQRVNSICQLFANFNLLFAFYGKVLASLKFSRILPQRHTFSI